MKIEGRRSLKKVWPEGKPVVGVVHLLPLPGSPRWGGEMGSVVLRAIREATLLEQGGVDGILVENFQDAPFFPGAVPPETVAAMTVAVAAIKEKAGVPVGINVLRNDAASALGVAAATGAAFIRVNVHTGSMFTDQGLIQGEAHLTLRKRAALGLEVAILADVLVKHATPPPGTLLETATKDSWFRGLADGLILTGTATGAQVDPEELQRVREALPDDGQLWVGSGATAETAGALLAVADGLIVGSALQTGGVAGGGVDEARVRAFMVGLGRG
jgi:membrane complex biogenesis BtpA family protein